MPTPAPVVPRSPMPAQSSAGMYSRLLVPVAVVTTARGREVFGDSRRLFDRLEMIGRELHRTGETGLILALWQGEQHVSEAGVAALEAMLSTVGLEAFNCASKSQRGGARAIGTKYQWYFLSEYLGWEWERA